MESLPRWAAQLPLLADGPVRDWLTARGLAADQSPEALNATRPDAVKAAHRAFAQAGATLIRTNTRHASRIELSPHGLAERCEAIHNSASALARQGAGVDVAMAGTLTPIQAPAGDTVSIPDRDRAASEQLIYLSDTGVDLFMLEHFDAVEDIERVIHLAGDVSDAPVLALLRLDERGRVPAGASALEAGERLLAAGAQSLGLSCASWNDSTRSALAALAALGIPLAIMLRATADVPEQSPDRFAESLAAAADAGAKIVGGCCGAMPAHIRAAATRLGR
jgi:5-methyltetrahydrofolate--homocysteine methyltransferase